MIQSTLLKSILILIPGDLKAASSAGPRCVMGRSRSGEGLLNLVKKMAPASRQQVSFYIILNINRIQKSGVGRRKRLRTWKEAFFNEKVCCPHQRCTNETAFFNEAGLEHLFILQDSAGPLEIVTFP